MKKNIKTIIIFIIGILISIIINVYSITTIKSKEIIHEDKKILESTSDPDYINGVYSSSNTINSKISNINSRVTQLETTYCKYYTGYSAQNTVSIGFTTKSSMVGYIFPTWVYINSYNIKLQATSVGTGVSTFTMPSLRDSTGNVVNNTAKDVFICWFYAKF